MRHVERCRDPGGEDARKRRLSRVIARYLEEVDAGRKPDPEGIVARHPELAGELRSFFAGAAALDHLGEDLRETAGLPALAPGTEIGDYEILEEIARGGMGIVYRARQKALRRVVALKMLRSGGLATAEEIRRFHREAEAAAALDHPGIVPIYEVGEHEGRYYFSMKLVGGGSLAEHRERLRGDPRGAARVMETVARAVHYAHLRGILHRDLKPGNILLDEAGNPLVADFGLARALDAESTLTRSGAILGTPTYMAPEQATGEGGAASPATDVYSLGAILYELLTGRPPFRGEASLAVLRAVVEEDPKPPHTANPAIPRDLETICLKCLEKDPHRRYLSAAALADDLQRFLAGRPIEARRVLALERLWRWCRRNPALAGLAGAVLALLVVIAIGSLLTARELRDKLWSAYLEQARAGRMSGLPGQRLRSLEALANAAAIRPAPELRDEAIRCFALTDLELLRYLDVYAGEEKARGMGLDGAFERYAFTDKSGKVHVHRLSDGAELMVLPGPERSALLEFSPGGRFLAVKHGRVITGGPLRVWDLEDTTRPILEEASRIGFADDGRTAALGRFDGSIRLFDLVERRETRPPLRVAGRRLGSLRELLDPAGLRAYRLDRVIQMALRPGAGAVAVSGPPENHVVALVDLQNGAVIRELVHPRGARLGVTAIAWHPDGGLLATACAPDQIRLWSAETGEERVAMRGLSVQALAFNHGGDLLASTGWDLKLRLWETATGRQWVAGSGTYGVRFSRDDSLVASMSQTSRLWLWRLHRARELRTLRDAGTVADTEQQTVTTIDFSPDGRWLLGGVQGGSASIWELSSARRLASVMTGRDVKSAFFDGELRSFVTWEERGLRRWPLAIDADSGKPVIGSPDFLGVRPRGSFGEAVLAADRRTVALVPRRMRGEGLLLDLDHPGSAIPLKGRAGLFFVAVSPDSRLVAGGPYKGSGIHIWDSATGERVKDLPAAGSVSVAFSPDGRWLVAGSSHEYRFWEVGSWRPRMALERDNPGEVPGRMAFSPDGTLAIADTLMKTRLVDPATGRELAILEAPDPEFIQALRFSPSGNLLAVAGTNRTIQLWDLERIRARLAAMGLGDW